ncbi:hypothetical protein L3Q82_017633 [Scortum barcoo]|uniref:Uncharacterized protein n=1 Tax=Scortum barcoo TaxID=214431 RepID=A0ACB8VLF4_9TELE|nr:hypothetical protein L3Q82_017633 [Scortum barcoo]
MDLSRVTPLVIHKQRNSPALLLTTLPYISVRSDEMKSVQLHRVSPGICPSTPILSIFQGLPFFHLRNIAEIRHFLSQSDAEKLIHAFVSSRLDYCNSLLSGCPNKSLKTLQLVQNAAARVLTRTRKRDHITPVLASLHWLPCKSLEWILKS